MDRETAEKFIVDRDTAGFMAAYHEAAGAGDVHALKALHDASKADHPFQDWIEAMLENDGYRVSIVQLRMDPVTRARVEAMLSHGEIETRIVSLRDTHTDRRGSSLSDGLKVAPPLIL